MRRRDNTTGGTQARWDPHVRFLALCSPETAPLCPVSVGPSGKTFDVRVNARTVDISTALHLLEHVQERVEDCNDPKLQMHTTQDIKSLISLLEDPVFRSIVTIQDSLIELNSQLGQHPSIIPGDFDINISGQLELSVPSTPVQPLGSNVYQDLYQDSSELEDQRVPVVPLVHSSSEDTSAQVTSPSLVSEVMGMPPITTTTYVKEFKKVIEAAARGRQIFTVQLYKPEGTSLGFSVVGLRSKDKGELGIFLQEIQPNGIAGCITTFVCCFHRENGLGKQIEAKKIGEKYCIQGVSEIWTNAKDHSRNSIGPVKLTNLFYTFKTTELIEIMGSPMGVRLTMSCGSYVLSVGTLILLAMIVRTLALFMIGPAFDEGYLGSIGICIFGGRGFEDLRVKDVNIGHHTAKKIE
ncbi:Patj like protein [Eufriesea mexicana]|nr:Patj like protein [Eufriesea mexicana]